MMQQDKDKEAKKKHTAGESSLVCKGVQVMLLSITYVKMLIFSSNFRFIRLFKVK